MIDPANAAKFQYASGHDGLKLYRTYTASHTILAGSYGTTYYYDWRIPIFDGDTSSDGFRDYIYYIYGRFTGGPNTSTRWYDISQYPNICKYRSTSGGAAKDIMLTIDANNGEIQIDVNDIDGGSPPTVVYDDVRIDLTIHIVYAPTILL